MKALKYSYTELDNAAFAVSGARGYLEVELSKNTNRAAQETYEGFISELRKAQTILDDMSADVCRARFEENKPRTHAMQLNWS